MAQGGLIGNDQRVAFAAASPQVWKKLEQVMDCTPPVMTNAKIDNTVHKPGGFKTNTTGLADVADVVIKMVKDPDPATSPNQNQLFSLLAAKTLLWWRVELRANPDTTINSFAAYEFQGRVGAVKDLAPLAALQERTANVVFGGTSLVEYQPMASLIG